ncbi:hypothetical protein GFS60_07851 (plasmid) [Rhodococcus sp. WAY2]|nr:hypothetical protein GFS60_07851 [Rhodococcus sp. WAY2]
MVPSLLHVGSGGLRARVDHPAFVVRIRPMRVRVKVAHDGESVGDLSVPLARIRRGSWGVQLING